MTHQEQLIEIVERIHRFIGLQENVVGTHGAAPYILKVLEHAAAHRRYGFCGKASEPYHTAAVASVEDTQYAHLKRIIEDGKYGKVVKAVRKDYINQTVSTLKAALAERHSRPQIQNLNP